jgi:exonuclease VII small subunit
VQISTDRQSSVRKAITLRVIRLLLLLALVGSLAVAVSACGTDEQAERAAAQARAKAVEDRRDQAELKRLNVEHDKKVDVATALATACQAQMGELVDAIGDLNSRLDIGMNYDEYTDEVSDLKVSYDDIDFDLNDDIDPSDTFKCLQQVGVPAEKALNEYAKATRTWSNCQDDLYCTNDSIDTALQRRWRQAASQADKAEAGLDELQDTVKALEREAPTIEDVRAGGAAPADAIDPDDDIVSPEDEGGTTS